MNRLQFALRQPVIATLLDVTDGLAPFGEAALPEGTHVRDLEITTVGQAANLVTRFWAAPGLCEVFGHVEIGAVDLSS